MRTLTQPGGVISADDIAAAFIKAKVAPTTIVKVTLLGGKTAAIPTTDQRAKALLDLLEQQARSAGGALLPGGVY